MGLFRTEFLFLDDSKNAPSEEKQVEAYRQVLQAFPEGRVVVRVLDAGEGFVDEAHAAGAFVGTWLTDDASTAVSLLRGGVDAVATNDPAVIVAARDAALG